MLQKTRANSYSSSEILNNHSFARVDAIIIPIDHNRSKNVTDNNFSSDCYNVLILFNEIKLNDTNRKCTILEKGNG